MSDFDTGDDCIALKSGRNADGRRLATPVQQVVIQDCLMKSGHGGVVIGSEISGGANHIFARRLLMSSPDLDRGLRIKTRVVRIKIGADELPAYHPLVRNIAHGSPRGGL